MTRTAVAASSPRRVPHRHVRRDGLRSAESSPSLVVDKVGHACLPWLSRLSPALLTWKRLVWASSESHGGWTHRGRRRLMNCSSTSSQLRDRERPFELCVFGPGGVKQVRHAER